MEPQYTKTDTLLSVKNLSLSFGKKKILSDVNFEIKDIVVPGRSQGQVVALVGISGKGKTQLLRMLAGLTHTIGPKAPEPKPEDEKESKLAKWLKRSSRKLVASLVGHKEDTQLAYGEILVGKEQKPVKEGDMGIIFQEYYMPEWLRIKKMLIKAARKNPFFSGNEKSIEAAVVQIMTEFEIIDHVDKFPCQLSGGQRQRANIAMQLLNGSDFILMDEPYSGLDPLMIDKITNLLRRVSLSDELKTFIIVSHDLENCIAIADTVYILSDKGREPGTGATIIKEIDLIARDLAWHPEVKRMPGFHDTIAEVKSLLA